MYHKMFVIFHMELVYRDYRTIFENTVHIEHSNPRKGQQSRPDLSENKAARI